MAEAGAKTSKGRIKITLACSECLSRNCKTTRARDSATALQLNKFCPTCKKHTLHKETK